MTSTTELDNWAWKRHRYQHSHSVFLSIEQISHFPEPFRLNRSNRRKKPHDSTRPENKTPTHTNNTSHAQTLTTHNTHPTPDWNNKQIAWISFVVQRTANTTNVAEQRRHRRRQRHVFHLMLARSNVPQQRSPEISSPFDDVAIMANDAGCPIPIYAIAIAVGRHWDSPTSKNQRSHKTIPNKHTRSRWSSRSACCNLQRCLVICGSLHSYRSAP